MHTRNSLLTNAALLAGLLNCLLLSSWAHSADLVSQETTLQYIPKAVAASLEKSQIPKEAISISVVEIEPGRAGKVIAKTELDWRSKQAMNPASTMKLITTLTGLDVLGPQYRWRTNIYTDGLIRQGTLKGNLYLQGTGDPKLVPEEFAKMMKALQNLGIQKIDGNLFFDRSAYAAPITCRPIPCYTLLEHFHFNLANRVPQTLSILLTRHHYLNSK